MHSEVHAAHHQLVVLCADPSMLRAGRASPRPPPGQPHRAVHWNEHSVLVEVVNLQQHVPATSTIMGYSTATAVG
jgi:hypothetical protein